MLNFQVAQDKCTGCGLCAQDCPAGIIAMEDGHPAVAPDKESSCYDCRHCLAICPAGGISIRGSKPEDSRPLAGAYPEPDKLETLIKGRRSIRRYREENLDPALLDRLLEVAGHAPSGVNTRKVRLTVIDDREKLAKFRIEVLNGLRSLAEANALPERFGFFAGIVKAWDENGVDVLFRAAPHLLVASAPADVATPVEDCLIALTTFELFAQANGVGTVWGGLVKWAITELVPEARRTLGIPDDHVIGYAMAFGRPAVRYARTVQRGVPSIHRVA